MTRADPGLLRAGKMAELLEPTGEWVFVDIGFSARGKTCGYLRTDVGTDSTIGRAAALTYGELTREISALVQVPGPPLHLVLEAPLSAVFGPEGNPMGRTGERRGSQTRYWYAGLGCAVLVASLYLIKAIMDAGPRREVRLFEAMVTFKKRSTAPTHEQDAEALWAAVSSGPGGRCRFIQPGPIDERVGTVLASTFALLGLDGQLPPIIQVIDP